MIKSQLVKVTERIILYFQQKWNFVILTKHFAEDKHSRRFGDSLRSHDFIKNFSIFPIKSKTIRSQLAHAALYLKGLVGTYVPSYQGGDSIG